LHGYKLIAAHPSDHAVITKSMGQSLARLSQQLVPGGVSQRIVDQLEPV